MDCRLGEVSQRTGSGWQVPSHLAVRTWSLRAVTLVSYCMRPDDRRQFDCPTPAITLPIGLRMAKGSYSRGEHMDRHQRSWSPNLLYAAIDHGWSRYMPSLMGPTAAGRPTV